MHKSRGHLSHYRDVSPERSTNLNVGNENVVDKYVKYKPIKSALSTFIAKIGSTNHYARIHSPTHIAPNASSSNSFIFLLMLLLLLAAIILVPLYLTGNLSSGFTSEHYNNIVNPDLFSHQI